MMRGLKIQKFLIVCLCSVVLMSCERRGDEAGGVEGAEARALISLIKGDLDKTKRELTDLKQDLQGVMEVQNELVENIKQLLATGRESVPPPADNVAGPDVTNFIAQLNEQRQSLSRLESRITQLSAMVENLRTSVTEQQAAINDLLNVVEEQAVIGGQQENIEQQEDADF